MTEPIALFPDWRSLPVHPAASAFRMMTDEEVKTLAADIKANGLVYPVVRGNWEQDGRRVHGIIDGRNRLRACEMAGVEPSFTEFKGDDPRDFIFSANGERRNVTIGQKALAYALIYPEPAQRTETGRGKKLLGSQDFMSGQISQARTIIKYTHELVDKVKSGITALDTAYRQALERKKAEEWLADGMRRLRQIAEDLAIRVEAGDITFDEARTLLNERENQAREVRQTIFQGLRDFVRDGQGFVHGKRLVELPQWLEVEEYETEFRRYFPGGPTELLEKAQCLSDAAQIVNEVLAQIKKRGRK